MKNPVLPILLIAASLMNVHSQTAAELPDIWDQQHVTNIYPSNVRHKDLMKYLEGLRAAGVKVDEVGRSYANREIFQIEWGKGPKRIFMWSQMHGDEPTATSGLIDMFAILRKNQDADWVRRLENTVTIRAVPMLNPDGAELFIRRNLQGIDINRDALDLKTPEAQLLKRLRENFLPEVGFNLHNQNELTTVGSTRQQATISFLVVYGDAEKTESDGHLRNKRLVVAMAEALRNYIPGNLGRYGDGYTPTAFGDSFSAWGTPTILIETGALHGRDELFLVKMNFIAFLTALRSLADGSEKTFDPQRYYDIPNNTSGALHHIIVRNASIVKPPKRETFVGDIALNFERRRAAFPSPTSVRQIGNLTSVSGLTEYDATGFDVVGRIQAIKPGVSGDLLFYKKGRAMDWTVPDLERRFEPDAILSFGKWVKGEGVVPKR